MVYTMMTNNPDVMEPDKMDANVCARDHNVQIDFGKFSVNLGDDSEERWHGSEFSSAASVISPCTLDKRLKGMSRPEVDVGSWDDMDLASKPSNLDRRSTLDRKSVV